ncbi:hypothetical protein EAH87_05660 [Sphingomonas koreensis]|nr:hypothetical protein EAH87_05660 [Sphingomonas koreensis]
MAWLIPIAVIAIGFLVNVGAFIWAALDGPWISAGAGSIVTITGIIVLAQAIGGHHALEYGLLLAFSLFFSAVMTMLGIIAMIARRIG